MNITPKNILEKEFPKKFNGYDPEFVDEFLDQIIKQFESLIEENENVIAKNESLKIDTERMKQKNDTAENLDKKLMTALEENRIILEQNESLKIELDRYKQKTDALKNAEKKLLDTAEENKIIVAQNVSLKLEMEELKIKANKLESTEERLMTVVLSAQRNASIYIDRAETQAQKIMDMANENAKAMMESTHIKLETAKEDLHKYENLISDYKKKFKLFLDEQSALIEAKFSDDFSMNISASEVSQSLSDITKQISDLNDAQEFSPIHLNEILRQSKEQNNHDFNQATSDLKDIVNEII